MTASARILVAEDEIRIAEVMQSYLERDGHVVALAATGEDALTDMSHHTFDLLVLDLGLPGVSGEEVCRQVRTIDADVKNLRRKLGDDARAPRLIRTVYGRGYSFVEDER
jgi:DNA-binding response OmpR family regulator